MSRLIIVVTGANSGIGFAVCQRLIQQLCFNSPPDARPQFDLPGSDAESLPYSRTLTLVMACRDLKKAETARRELFNSLDTQLARHATDPDRSEYGDFFRNSLKIDIEYCDLAIVSSVLKCAETLQEKYPYISHLICNAGTSSFRGIDWFFAITHYFAHPILAVTLPPFYLETPGVRSVDGLGWVWQCNVFGHYVLYRGIQSLLSSYAQSSNGHHPARVLWTTSMEAIPTYHPDDWQLLKTARPYQSSKYMMDLIASQLECRAMEEAERISSPAPIHHFLVHPGIASTGITAVLASAYMTFFALLSFYIGRFLGSPHHTIQPLKAAVSAVHVCLTPLQYLPTTLRFPKCLTFSDLDSPFMIQEVLEFSGTPWKPYPKGEHENLAPLPAFRFGSQCDWIGRESVGLTRVRQWKEHEEESKVLLGRCEDLYQSFIMDPKGAGQYGS